MFVVWNTNDGITHNCICVPVLSIDLLCTVCICCAFCSPLCGSILRCFFLTTRRERDELSERSRCAKLIINRLIIRLPTLYTLTARGPLNAPVVTRLIGRQLQTRPPPTHRALNRNAEMQKLSKHHPCLNCHHGSNRPQSHLHLSSITDCTVRPKFSRARASHKCDADADM